MNLRRTLIRRRDPNKPWGNWPWPPPERRRARARRLVLSLLEQRDLQSARRRSVQRVSPPDKDDVADISDGICAYMVGGLGNQLLLLAAAWEQAARLGCPLYVDNSGYTSQWASRAPDLHGIDLPGVDITERSPWPWLLSGPQGLIPVTVGRQQLHVFTERSFGYDPLINTCVPGTTITGFCQSPMYFPTVAGELAKRLLSAELLPAEADYVDAVTRDLRVTLHLRRGDYLSGETLHGIAEIGYFRRAVRLHQRLHGASRYRVYSDSPETLDGEFQDFPDVEISRPAVSMRSIAVLRSMACANGFIMSNSTFSWWAAWLMTIQDSQATVIAPRPWFSNGESASDLLLPDWITLDRRG